MIYSRRSRGDGGRDAANKQSEEERGETRDEGEDGVEGEDENVWQRVKEERQKKGKRYIGGKTYKPSESEWKSMRCEDKSDRGRIKGER